VLRIVRTARVVAAASADPTDPRVDAAIERAQAETEDLFLEWGWRHRQEIEYETETDVIWANAEAKRVQH